MRTMPLLACPACGGSSSVAAPLHLRQCTACGLVHAAEYADPEDVYVDGYLEGETPFGLDVTAPSFQAFLAFAAEKRLRWIERQVGGPGRLLDVGCGSGEVLEVAVARGWDAVGVEPVARSAAMANARGVTVHPSMLEDSGLPESSFDVVSAFHVLEHMVDGPAFLRLLGRWARPGGHVVVEVPNWASRHRRVLAEGWPGLRPLEHLAHHDPATVAATLERAGLEPVAVRSMGFLWSHQTLDESLVDLGLLGLRSRTRGMTRPEARDGQPIRASRPAVFGALRAYEVALDRRRAGHVVLAIARRPR